MSKTDDKSSANDVGLDMFALSLEQTRKIQEMEKQVEFYKERVSSIICMTNKQYSALI